MTVQTIASIAKKAFDKVATKVNGVIHSAQLVRAVVNTYDPSTGKVSGTDDTEACRIIFASGDAGNDVFPEIIITAPDEIVYLEGLVRLSPRKDDELHIGLSNIKWRINNARDLMQGGGLWAAVARPV